MVFQSWFRFVFAYYLYYTPFFEKLQYAEITKVKQRLNRNYTGYTIPQSVRLPDANDTYINPFNKLSSPLPHKAGEG